MIEVKNLTKHYGHTVAVKDVSFTVNQGEVLGFLGPNGAGKTTTMKIITCFMPATFGTVSVAGFDVAENSLEVRKRIGYLPENTPLYTDIMVEDYLKFISEIRKIPKFQVADRIKSIIDTCGLRSVLKKDIGELSKGFKQRVGLAQAMIHDPDILVLDEPTSGLDPKQIIEIRQLIKNLAKKKTIILSTHILPEVSATCDRVIIINDGVLAASGTTEELQEKAEGDSIVYTTITADSKKVEDSLKSLDFVRSFNLVSKLTSTKNRYKITVKKDQQDVEELIFKIAVDKGWVLSELYSESLSLEDIFIKLTTTGQ